VTIGSEALTRDRPRPRRRAIAAAVVVLVALAGATAALGRPYDDRLPPRVSIAGVDVGGAREGEAAAAIAEVGRDAIAKGLVLTSGSGRTRLSLRRIKIAPDTADALRRAKDVGFIDRVRERLGLGGERVLQLRFRFDAKTLPAALRTARRRFEVKPVAADVRITTAGDLRLVRGRGGIAIDVPALSAGLRDLLRLNGTMELPLKRVRPAADDPSARAAMAAAETLLETPHDLLVLGHAYRVRRAALSAALDFEAEGGAVRLRLTRPPIEAELRRLFGAAESEAENAHFAVGPDGGIVIDESRVGRSVGANSLRATLAAEPALRRIPVQIVDIKPTFTTEDARALKITDLVGSFTTPYAPGEPRVTNIQRAAEVLDGRILQPYETFSLNAALGPRTIDAGYVVAPQIADGELQDAVGGGVSQVATTLFNAAFLAGLRLDAHTPHEFWISRYPRGREATVSWGGPELVFTNDFDAPLVLLVDAGASQITVRMFSRSLDRRVEYGEETPTDIEPPGERRVANEDLEPGEEKVLQKAGSDGFKIVYWRKVYRGETLARDERFTAAYRPQDRIVEEGPKPEDGPPSTTGTGPGESTAPTDSTSSTEAATTGG
jgi:vancomycin resistance protein YoaR